MRHPVFGGFLGGCAIGSLFPHCKRAFPLYTELVAIPSSAKRKNSRKQASAPSSQVSLPPLFWVRPPDPELDRAGDFILACLPEVRMGALPRGDSR